MLVPLTEIGKEFEFLKKRRLKDSIWLEAEPRSWGNCDSQQMLPFDTAASYQVSLPLPTISEDLWPTETDWRKHATDHRL